METAVHLQDVRKTLSGTPVLQGCDLALEAGQVHAFVGPGGSGKTLLLKVVATLLQPDSGAVRLFDDAVAWNDPDALRQVRSRIGMQFQNLALFDFLSVGDNVAFPLLSDRDHRPPAEEVDRRVAAALASVRLPDAGPLPVQSLSGGMQRRVAIARAAVSDADLLLFDDPTGGLDPVTSSRIFELVEDIHAARHCTVVIASHDIERLERVCHRFHVVDGGRVTFSGPLEAGRAHPDDRVRTFLDVDGNLQTP